MTQVSNKYAWIAFFCYKSSGASGLKETLDFKLKLHITVKL